MIKIEITKKQRQVGLTARQKFALGFARALGPEVRRRVKRRAQPHKRHRGFSTAHHRHVAPKYPAQGGERYNIGLRVFDSSAAFHSLQGSRKGSFNVSGGMWSGLTIKGLTQKGAQIRFRGRSQGQMVKWKMKTKGRGQNKRKVRVAGSLRVSNALKAYSAARAHGSNFLTPIPSERSALQTAVASWLKGTVARQIGAIDTGRRDKTGLGRLGRAALRNIMVLR